VNDIELLITLVAAAAVLVRLADSIGIPYPIVLVIGGIAIALIPGQPRVELDPDVVFLVFLPPLLQSAGYYASPRELYAEGAPLAGLLVALPLATMVGVAAVAQAVIPEIGWAEGLVLGAIVAPTDPVAAIATFDRIGVAARVRLLVEGESMLNDATALVAYRVALAAVVTGAFSAGDAAVELVLAVAGGIGIGLAIGWAAIAGLRRLDDPPLAILISVLTAYAGFAIAEHFEASGVLAVVATGIYMGWFSHDAFDADLRLSAQSFWRTLVFALNAILFILLGLQLPEIVETIERQLGRGEMVGYGLLVAGVVIGLRIAWQFLPEALGRVFPSIAGFGTGTDWRERLLVGWSGMRGAVSLALALALPLQLDDGPFAERDLIIYLTVAVIICTLVLQGLTLPRLIRRLGLGAERAWSPEEAIARLEAAQAALDALEEIEAEHQGEDDPALERLRELYRARFARCVSAIEGKGEVVPLEDPVLDYQTLRRQLLGVERAALVGLRNSGRIRPDIFRRIQRDLDLEEARLRSRG
jgi:monovalent cation/hydrogen antiporter